MYKKLTYLFFVLNFVTFSLLAQNSQSVEGFDQVLFHNDANRSRPQYDFRGNTVGYMTAGWWANGQKDKSKLSWKTAAVPAKTKTRFSFIGASSVLPAEITFGPAVKLSVNGKYALTFNLGKTHNFTWQEGDYELKYISKRIEIPYTGAHREFGLDGNSGIYELTVPASAVEAGKASTIEVELLPFERWANGWFMIKEYRDVLKPASPASLEGQVNTLIRDVGVLSEQTHILATQLYSKMLGTDKYEHNIVYTNGYRHLHPADIITLKNGDILLMTREASEHYANDGDIVMVRSKDGGKTWGERQVISAIKDLDEREGCGIQLNDGTIIVGVFYNDLYIPEGTYNWDGKVSLPDVGRARLGTHFISSKDNGKTWADAKFMDFTGMPFKGTEGPTDAPILMPDGSLVMGVIAYGMDHDPAKSGSVMLKSTDQGNTWQYLSTMAMDTNKKLGGFLEPGIVRTKSGRIVAAYRNHSAENAIYTNYSDDDGKTWSPVTKTEMIGHPVDLIQLSDGRLMATYGIRSGTGRHTEPGGIRACFSSDNGKTWDIKSEVQIRNDFINWDTGYPESLEMKDGKVMTVYYFNLFGKYFIGSTFWTP